ncbi:MAG: hypothetical protein JXA54_03690 [Candidatus Heimdallarchaeota archaeon]|nr:hypothetical protein [Candidatus Heimdallarchaeota archaeon]
MITRLISYIAKLKICSKIKYDKLLNDIPNQFFLDLYNTRRANINAALIILSSILSLLLAVITFFFDIFLGFLVLVVIFLASILFLIRKLRKQYLDIIMEVEQFADLVCREMFLIMSITKSISTIIEFLSQGTYPIISPLLLQTLKKMNVGATPDDLLEKFAWEQPSETIRQFILEIIIPISKGNLEIKKTAEYETQWRIRKNFDFYLSQLEGKMSIFLAITTIIPITISMLLVMLGYISISLLVFLPLVFFVFDLIAVEIFNSGKIKLLGG